MIASLTIRRLVQADLPALEWDGEYAHFRRLYEEIYGSSLRGKAVLWVAALPNPGIIGQLFVQLSSARAELADGVQRAYVYGFRVKPAYRGQGVGSQMMRVAEADLFRRGFQTVTLNVAQDNPGALRLYERLGYRPIAEEPGVWSYQDEHGDWREVREPAWRMEKQLNGRR